MFGFNGHVVYTRGYQSGYNLCNNTTVFAYMQGVQLDTERKAEWSQSVRVDAKQQLILESTVPRHGAESGVV